MKPKKQDLSGRKAKTLCNGAELKRMSVYEISKLKDTALRLNLTQLGLKYNIVVSYYENAQDLPNTFEI